MERPADIIDRETEWKTLTDIAARKEPDLVFVTGRRRAGKSHLLARFCNASAGLYYQATRRTERDQLAAVSMIVGERFNDSSLKLGVPFPSWESMFGYLLDKSASSPLMFVIDEFPYMAEASPSLPSIIQAQWDHKWNGSNLKLVLSGSYISVMKRLEESDQPLYGRRTARIAITPFSVTETAAFLPSYAAEDCMRVHAIFGGLPGNLTLLRDDEPLEKNVMRLILNPSGRLSDDAAHVLDAFLGSADVHYSIVEAIAGGNRTWAAITRKIGKNTASLSRPLNWLLDMEIIERVVPISVKNPARTKRIIYRLADPYLAFWHRFIGPMVRAGSLGLADPNILWSSSILPALNDYMGGAFEQCCRMHVRRKGMLPFQPVRTGEWWGPGSRDEIDVCALGANGEIFAGEAKWGKVSSRDLHDLKEKTAVLADELGDRTSIWYGLFSGRGEFDASIINASKEDGVLLFSSEDLVSQNGSPGFK